MTRGNDRDFDRYDRGYGNEGMNRNDRDYGLRNDDRYDRGYGGYGGSWEYGLRNDDRYDRGYGDQAFSRYGYGNRNATDRGDLGGYTGDYYGDRFRFTNDRGGYGRTGTFDRDRFGYGTTYRGYGGYGGGPGDQFGDQSRYGQGNAGYGRQAYGAGTGLGDWTGRGMNPDQLGDRTAYGYGQGRQWGYGQGWQGDWAGRGGTDQQTGTGFGIQYGGNTAATNNQQGQYSGQYAGRGPKNYQRSDERIKEDVNEQLADHPGLDASEIDVQVKNGEVTLTGTVQNRQMKRMADMALDDVRGVRDVHNQIKVQQNQGGEQQAQSGTGQKNK